MKGRRKSSLPTLPGSAVGTNIYLGKASCMMRGKGGLGMLLQMAEEGISNPAAGGEE